MKRYTFSPGHMPGCFFLQNKRQFTGLIASILIMIFALLPIHEVTADQGKTSVKNSSSAKHKSRQQTHPRDMTYMKRKWGVELLFVRVTSAGYMLEFRYKVLDAKKSKLLFERQIKPVLTHVKTGAKLIVPTPAKTGALRNSNPPKTGKVYWMFFANPGKLVKPGDKVNIDIGDFHANGLVVKE